jgi:alpha-L-arabinofuranosidase
MSWRDHIQIHPAAEVFPLMGADELRKLAADINANGLQVPIQTCTVDGETYIEDGRNRLDAMELLGWQIVNERGEWQGALATVPGTAQKVVHRVSRTHKQVAADVIAFNIRRRHLSKEEQVQLIDAALRAANSTDFATMARSVTRGDDGRLQGSTKDQHKAAVMREAAKAKISKRTVERVLAKPTKNRPKRTVDDTSREFVMARLQKFMDYWTVTKHRAVKKICREFFTT